MLEFPLRHVHFSHLLPIFDHTAVEFLSASKKMTYSLTGFETLFSFILYKKCSTLAKVGALWSGVQYF
ncbi:GerAB/ArcD/ProY family transporter [[Brevibacterium] frigoritolerans]|uniref:GerAB/ArcD/ProY family transporter n=1 Tax=Peribacillus frigoritolerans TaxID=450367 RepID=A0A941FH76_9BACI|nr:GerAB/ArcD/ProY family transporter [Peribacillus frigoritolerans]